MPTTPQQLTARLWMQLGVCMDVFTGELGLSDRLRASEKLPERHRLLFPWLTSVDETSSWPRTLLLHGDIDHVTILSDSVGLAKLLEGRGIDVELVTVPGGSHGGDMQAREDANWQAAKERTASWLQEVFKAKTDAQGQLVKDYRVR